MADEVEDDFDDFGEVDDDDLILAVHQAEQRPAASPLSANSTGRATKRRRLNGAKDSKVSFPSRNYQSTSRPSSILNGKSRSPNGLDTPVDEDDAFDPAPHRVREQFASVRAQKPYSKGAQSGLRQMTLFGGTASGPRETLQTDKRHKSPVATQDEPPTHHMLHREALKTWVYPTNLGTIRDYQFNIVQKALYNNLLVALPTGLGKTFIAATVMLNWFRWTADAKIVFVAPTKPLVSQQVEACFKIAGIPRSQTTMLTGGTAPGIRAEEWLSKRVFFMTPQTILNDLKTGICDPKKIVLLVVDEAHRATGAYAYVEVVKFLRRFNPCFRVLALTATPGSSVEDVQEVVDGLGIARTEIRTEESIDIRQYVHSRKTETILFDPSDEIVMLMELFSKALQPLVDKLCQQNAYWSKDPMALTPYGMTQARHKWTNSEAGRRASMPLKGLINTIFTLLSSIAHSIVLLRNHGIGPFYHNMVRFRDEGSSGGKKSKWHTQIVDSEHFRTLMTRVRSWISDPDFVGHPKLDYLRSVVMNHFLDAGEGGETSHGVPPAATRIMVFVQWRDSAEEVVRILKRSEPMIRPHVFVGQANAKGSDGMDQKKQLEIIHDFKKGKYNTLVATSIGEEGLDIGEVDLIVCFDSSASPIRMLQRMGRTGRKRAGNIVLLLMRGKEENSFVQAKDNYEKMQQMISSSGRFNYHLDLSPRIIPREIQPVVDKQFIEIPPENSQSELPEPKRRAKPPKRPPKKFHMPDGARTGFTKASRLRDEAATDNDEEIDMSQGRSPTPEPDLPPSLDEVFLSAVEEDELKTKYQNVSGIKGQTVRYPRTDAFPRHQRTMRRTMHVGHSEKTKRAVSALELMHNTTDDSVRRSHNYSQAGEHDTWGGQPTDDEDASDDLQGLDSNRTRRLAGSLTKSTVVRSRKRSMLEGTSNISSSFCGHRQISVSADEESGSEDVDSDLDGFVVHDETNFTDHGSTSSPVSSPPSPDPNQKPFYATPNEIEDRITDSEEDLPEVGSLVHKPSAAERAPGKERGGFASPLVHNKRAERRNIILDSSDSEY
ncbi:MAG: 3'-5' DNA helicase [Sarea resinae]|nr:MAG: 3'-5' DNA helicase [Sarea resinae]